MHTYEKEVTALLAAWSKGDLEALDQLMPLVFDEVRDIATRSLAGESPAHTLQPTALVSEVYLRLTGARPIQFDNRTQLFGFLGGLMRRMLVDHARARKTAKRGSGRRRVTFDYKVDLTTMRHPEIEALDEALRSLASIDPRQSQILELRFVFGLTMAEIAEVLGTSLTTVNREWKTAKLWLRHELEAS